VVSLVTGDVRTANEPVIVPAASVMPGNVGWAAAGLLLVRVTATGPGAAGHSSRTLPPTVVPPRTRVDDKVSVCARIGRTVRFSACETPPNDAVTVPDDGAVTAAVVTEKVALFAPAGTAARAGTDARGLVFVNGTIAPAAPALPVRTTRPSAVPHPPMTVVGLR